MHFQRHKLALSEYRNIAYCEPRPHMATMRRRCERGDIPAQKEGGTWYVLLDKLEQQELSSGDSVVDDILSEFNAAQNTGTLRLTG